MLCDFLEYVLPSNGSYWVAYKNKTSNLKQIQIDSLSKLEKLLAQLSLKPLDLYVAIASYDGSTRAGVDVLAKKSYYVDLDVGENKPYKTKEEALKHVTKLIKGGLLDMPTYFISSGYGIHLYWALSEPISPERWVRGATGLKIRLTDIGLHQDMAVTSDVARILRVPGSFNQKGDTPEACKVLKFTGITYPPDSFSTPEVVNNVDNSDLGSVERDYPDRTYTTEAIVSKCGVLAKSLDEGGAEDSYDKWFKLLNVISYTLDKDVYAHKIGNHHTGYSEANTDAKLANIIASSKAPTRCDTFSALCPDICAACPHNGNITTPLQLGLVVETSQVASSSPTTVPVCTTLPAGYTATKGGVWHNVPNEDGGTDYEMAVKPTHRPLDLKLYALEDGIVEAKLDMLTGGKVIQIIFTGAVVNDISALRKLFGGYGMVLSRKDGESLQRFMMAWMDELQEKNKVTDGGKAFGWNTARTQFTIGETTYQKGLPPANSGTSEKVLTQIYKPQGSFDKWLHRANIIIKRPVAAITVASSFAAPLMALTEISGAVVSIVSPASGTGKTSSQRVAQGVWGDPAKAVNALNDTGNSITHKMAVTRHLPAYWDEVRGDENVRNLIQLIFQLTQGKEKSRLSAASEHKEIRSWQTLMITASNTSLFSYMADAVSDTTAGIQRIIEFTMPPLTEAERITQNDDRLFMVDFGHAGPMYAQWMVDNMEIVRCTLDKVMKALDEKHKPTAPERFRFTAAAAILAGAMLAKMAVGMDFDIRSLSNQIDVSLRGLRGETNNIELAASPVVLINKFINEHRQYALLTDVIYYNEPVLSPKLIALPSREIVHYNLGTTDGLLMIGASYLTAWLNENNLGSYGTLVKNLHEICPMVDGHYTYELGLGTPVRTKVPCLFIPTNVAVWGGKFSTMGNAPATPVKLRSV